MRIEDELGQEPDDPLPSPEMGDPILIAGVTEHFESILGSVEVVLHEASSTFVHIDIHQIEFEDGDDAVTYFTTGMAEHPMNVPLEVEEPEKYRYAELVLHVPTEYPRDFETLQLPKYWWPFRVMQNLARLPHERESWVWGGHTIRNGGEHDEPYSDDVKFTAAIVCPSYLLPDDSEVVELEDGRSVVLLTLAFIYPEEYDFCLENGSEAFLDRVADSGLSPFEFFVLDKNRRNVCMA